jgi:hypothetical protein
VVHEFFCNMTCVQIVFQNALNDPDEIPSMSATSQIVSLLFLRKVPSLTPHFSSVLLVEILSHSALAVFNLGKTQSVCHTCAIL